jgi:hypothetical protein
LQKWNVTSTHTPSEAILNCEANVPLQTTPRDNGREQGNQNSRNNDNPHGLTDGQTNSYLIISLYHSDLAEVIGNHILRKVFGVCKFETLREEIAQYPK